MLKINYVHDNSIFIFGKARVFANYIRSDTNLINWALELLLSQIIFTVINIIVWVREPYTVIDKKLYIYQAQKNMKVKHFLTKVKFKL